METGTAVIGAVALAICIYPFVWMSRLRKKAEQQLLTALNDFAAGHNGAVTRHEVFRDMVIGIDEQQNSVFFYKKSDSGGEMQYIPLSGIKTCKVIRSGQTINTPNGSRTVIEKILLAFVPAIEKEAVTELDFYDINKSVQLNGELQFAERWAQQLDERLKRA
jgi:hypothetical protein